MEAQRIEDSEFTCDVCGRRRAFDRISVARHAHTDGFGTMVEQLVNYCNDSEYCERTAMLSSHTALAYTKLQRELDKLQGYLHDRSIDRIFWFWVCMLGAFVTGFVIRGAI